MRAMKDSGIEWIGENPRDWVTKKLKYCVDLRLEKTADKASSASYIGLEHISSFTGTLCEDYEAVTDFNGDTLDFCEGDVLFGKLRPYLAKAYQAESEGRCSSEFWVMNPKEIEGRFLLYYVLSHGFISDIDHSTFGVKMPRAEWSYAGNEKIPVPPRQEQIRITQYLDARCAEIDALIAAKEKTNALLKERRQSIIFEAVTKGLDPTVPMKDSGVEWIGEIPSGWQIAPLKYFASIRSGFTLGKKYDSKLELLEYPYLRVANVQWEYTDLESITTIQMPAAEAEQYKLKAGELLMTEGGDRDKLGRGSIWRGEIPNCLHQNHIFALSTDDRLNIEYLDYLTASDVGRNYFDYTAVKTTNLASTNATTIMNFKIPIPSIDEQLKIVEYLKEKCQTIDGVFQINSEAIQKLKEYRQSLIYEAVTGKTEV